MILCGWCGNGTVDGDRCDACGHVMPSLPYVQRGQEPPAAPGETSRRLDAARVAIEASGQRATVERLAEHLDVSVRTVRRWQQVADR